MEIVRMEKTRAKRILITGPLGVADCSESPAAVNAGSTRQLCRVDALRPQRGEPGLALFDQGIQRLLRLFHLQPEGKHELLRKVQEFNLQGRG